MLPSIGFRYFGDSKEARVANVKSTPEGYHSVTPYLFIKGAANAIEFMHAELRIGDSVVMLADENLQIGAKSPETLGGTSSSLHVYFENVDAVAEKAVEAGAKLARPVKDQFYGDRTGALIDPFGHMWSIATHIEDVSREEMQKRAAIAMSQAAGG
jgi:PhnB protein